MHYLVLIVFSKKKFISFFLGIFFSQVWKKAYFSFYVTAKNFQEFLFKIYYCPSKKPYTKYYINYLFMSKLVYCAVCTDLKKFWEQPVLSSTTAFQNKQYFTKLSFYCRAVILGSYRPPTPGFPKLFFIIAPLAKIFKIVPPFCSTYRPLTS